jgi:hypothetical protein
MNVVNVYKQAAGFVYELDFAAGATSWSFISQHTGKLVKAVTTNVTSYQIAGANVNYPFQITNSNSYAVTIVPTDTAQPATIKFYADDSDYSSVVLNAQNFATGNGRFIYCLQTTQGLITIIDTSLLVASNYISNGDWIVNPIIGDVSLPVITNVTWKNLMYCSFDDCLWVFGSNNSTAAAPMVFCKIFCLGVNQHTLWNLAGTVQNSYTSGLNNCNVAGESLSPIHYDFVNQKFHIQSSGRYQVSVNPFSQGPLINDSNPLVRISVAYSQKFDSINLIFKNHIADIDFANARTKNYTNIGGYSATCVYDYVTGYKWQVANGGSMLLDSYDANGTFINRINGGATYSAPALAIDSTNRRLVAINTGNLGFSINNLSTVVNIGSGTLSTTASGHTSCGEIISCPYSSIMIVKGGNGDGLKRLDVFNPMKSSSWQEGYLMLSNNITRIVANKLYR